MPLVPDICRTSLKPPSLDEHESTLDFVADALVADQEIEKPCPTPGLPGEWESDKVGINTTGALTVKLTLVDAALPVVGEADTDPL